MVLKLAEKPFLTCQGEGQNAGLPTWFIRLQGCNLAPNNCCKWCDTAYAQKDGGTEMPISNILGKFNGSKIDRFCITGGEPLMQEVAVHELVSTLVSTLVHMRHPVEIFTNGTLPMPSWHRQVLWTVDYKCPSSGVYEFDDSWLAVNSGSAIKFVAADVKDLTFILGILPDMQTKSKAKILVSPMIPKYSTDNYINPVEREVLTANWPAHVWNFCVTNNLRFSLQTHKVVWGNRKGV